MSEQRPVEVMVQVDQVVAVLLEAVRSISARLAVVEAALDASVAERSPGRQVAEVLARANARFRAQEGRTG